MATIKLKVGKNNGLKTIAKFNEFEIKGEFDKWTTNPDHFVSEVPLELIKGNTNNYFNLFHANYCNKNGDNIYDVLEIHVAKVYKPLQESYNFIYKVKKPKVEFSLDPKDSKAKVQVNVIYYDIDKRCPSDKFLHLCGKKTKTGVPFLSEKDCPPKGLVAFDGVPTQPDTKKGNILQGGN